ncbi:MAG: thiamine-phosphate kinase, partial [Candidatus Bathyarchaeota archaeon]
NLAVLKTDMLVGKTDVPQQMTYWQAARKAVVMNISDLAAKGVKPIGLLVSLGIPRNLTKMDIVQIGKGLNKGAREYDTYVLGGDTNETEDLVISISLFGRAEKGSIILRNGASPGDILATTGLFGLASSGLQILTKKLAVPLKIERKLSEAVLMPSARLKEGVAMAETGAITASIDSSDGLAWSLHEIAHASKVGFLIDALPIAPETYEIAKLCDLNPIELCLYGGEEYELIVTIKPSCWEKVKHKIGDQGGRLFRIGKAIAEEKLILRWMGKMIEIDRRGYEHLRTGRSNI